MPCLFATFWFVGPALLLEQAAKVVRVYSDGDDDEVASFFTSVFDGQDQISNDATENMTQPEIEAVLAEWARSATGVSIDDFNR